MANATSIILNALTADGAIAAPTAQIMDTGTAAVTVETPALSDMDRVFVRVTNTAVAALTVTVVAGDDVRPAWRKDLGSFTTGSIAQNATQYLGPFEAARFKRANGTLRLTFTPASGTIACNFDAFRLPRA